jgi:glyoxylase-like metal-dependent hydrolase (beta-lactamase superfamily II)
MAAPLVFNRQFDPRTGTPVPVAEGLVRVTAPNWSAFTFTGTNSFLVGHDSVALIDPGPNDPAHARALEAAVDGRSVTAIILTHTHRDHSALAPTLARTFRAPLWFGGPHRLSRPLRPFERNPLRRSADWSLQPDRTLVDGETIPAGDSLLTVHATPGHCANHLAFGLGADTLLTGDHVMGWNSTLVAVPDGSMRDYMASLRTILALPYTFYVPAHGGPIPDGRSYAIALRDHRLARSEQVVEAVSAGARSIAQVVDRIYPAQPLPVRLAARMTIRAHVEELAEQGRIRMHRRPWGLRLSL